MALILREQTAAQFAARFWRRAQAAHEAGQKLEYSRLIWWLYGRIQAGDLTSAQVRTSYNSHFGRALTVAQWNALVTTRFVPIRDRYQAILDEAAV